MKKENNESGKVNDNFDEQAIDMMIQEALMEDQFIAVPENFADRMEGKAKQINLYSFWQDELLKHITVMGGALLMLAVVFGVFYYFSPENTTGIINFLDRFKWLLLSGTGLVFFLQLADSWVVKEIEKSQV